MTENKRLKIEDYFAPPSVRANWVSGFFKWYVRILKDANEEELEEILNMVRFDWKTFNERVRMTEDKQFKCHCGVVGVHIGVGTEEHELTGDECRDLLNELYEEKEIAIDGIKIADELIRKYGSEELKLQWKKEVTVKYR